MCKFYPSESNLRNHMPDFKDTQSQLRSARAQKLQTEQALFLAKESLAKLRRRKARLLRSYGPDADIIQQLAEEETALQQRISQTESRLAQLGKVEVGQIAAFFPFTDPREQLEQFSDRYPLLLFPVRLETRFKRVAAAGTAPQLQLWVRVFPDECSVDTFEEVPSESEVRKTRDYWAEIWAAGSADDETLQVGIEGRRKAAWSNLANSFQAGRSYWLIQNYQPVDMTLLPTRSTDDEMILVIPTEDIPNAADQAALANYWTTVWLARADQGKIDAAYQDIVDAVGGEDRANELLSQNVPANYQSAKPAADAPPPVQVVFLPFPRLEDTDTKLAAWSQPARITTFPERFVLMGFRGTDADGRPRQVLSAIGSRIPDPLVVGPNPSMDTSRVLKDEFILELQQWNTEAEQTDALDDFYDKLTDAAKAEQPKGQFIADFLALPPDQATTRLEEIFDNFREEIKAARYINYLSQKSETKWLYDFEEAVNVGMGFKINLENEDFVNGFDRLFVLGVKLSTDEQAAQAELEEWIRHHHYGTSGISILPQGTPTNNTEEEESGFSDSENHDETYERYLVDADEADPDDLFSKRDGRWLAEFLGIDPETSTLEQVANYYQTDICEAKAMNVALWDATLGYFMENMLSGVFSEQEERVTRMFFTEWVSGRGNLPAIRIGDQPYGILPITRMSPAYWVNGEGSDNPLFGSKYGNNVEQLRNIYGLSLKIRNDFEKLLDKVAYVGKEGDAHQILLDALGLHGSSVEFYQRYAESFAHLFNRLNLTVAGGAIAAILILGGYRKRGMDLLQSLGYTPEEEDDLVPMLEKFFLTKANQLKGDLIDDQPLSEVNPIRGYTATSETDPESKNYIYWFIENALTDFDVIKKQQGFADNQRPQALLYQLLRHALTLAFADAGFRLYLNAEILDSTQVKRARRDADFVGIQTAGTGYVSKYDYLDNKESKITGGEITVAQHISTLLQGTSDLFSTVELRRIVNALQHLKDAPTARLERLLAEHLDLCTYRLDAWLLAFNNLQLSLMRAGSPTEGGGETQRGIYLGAYGWVEDLRPDPEVLTPIQLEGKLRDIFNPDGDKEIVLDSNNGGYIHAPSINHAITSAILRNAYISDASPEDPDIYKVNLSSERVRMAMGIIQGMQQGQSLGALLGYQLERGLHDRYQEAEVDVFIYELRKAFPLRGNRLRLTRRKLKDLDSISQVEARNVVNGLALINHIEESGETQYPFGKELRFAEEPEYATHRNIINEEVARLHNINDAVADLAIAESVHQVVQSNYDRAAATLDAFSKGKFVQTPDIARTPRSGINITNRVGIHLEPGLTALMSANPRVIAEPAVNQLLRELLPAMEEVVVRVSYTVPTYQEGVTNPPQEVAVTMAQLGFSPVDLLYILNVEEAKTLSALEEYLLKWIHRDLPQDSGTPVPRPDIDLTIQYTELVADKVTVFELMPLLLNLRRLILASRPLRSTDLQMPNEATNEADAGSTIRTEKVENAFAKFRDNFSDATQPENGIDLANDPFTALFVEEDFEATLANQEQIIEGIDEYIDAFIDRLHSLSLFGLQQAGFGFIYERKALIYANAYRKVKAYKEKWVNKLATYDQYITVDLPLATTDEERIVLLQKAEREISTVYTHPVPDVATYSANLVVRRTAFVDKLAELEVFLVDNVSELEALAGRLDSLQSGVGASTGEPLSLYDLEALVVDDVKRQIVVLGEDLVVQATKLSTELIKKDAAVQALLDTQAAEANPLKKVELLTEAAQTLLGESFKIVPEFVLGDLQRNELQHALAGQSQLLRYQTDEQGTDFPVDDWLYGMARVRGKMGHWESMVMLSETFTANSLELTPLQLPYMENDSWLGLEFPEDYDITEDKLLYTAYMPNFDPTQAQCGLLIDEWTEVIPTKTETTGLSFQYDQPNAEPAQSMLLVTPARFTGEWEWEDVVDALHETLDMARLRALEPAHIDGTAYAQFLPATVSAVTVYPFVTMALNYAVNNGVQQVENG